MKKFIILMFVFLTTSIFSQIIPNNVTDTLFVENFESGPMHWTFTGNWEITDEDSNSPAHSLTESPGGSYSSNENTTATLIDTMNFSPYYDANISFWIKYDIESDWDFMYLEATEDNGTTWSNLKTWTGEDIGWFQEHVSLGICVGSSEVNIRFRWQSDTGLEEGGTYIDDIIIKGTRSVPPDYATFIYDDPPQYYEGSFGEFTDTVSVVSYYTLTDVEVIFSVDGVSQENIIATPVIGEDWEFTIPFLPYGALIKYTFFARDSLNNETTGSRIFKYIAGDHRIYDSGIVSYYNTTENRDAKAVRISFPDADSLTTSLGRLYTILIRNYMDIDHSSDDMTIHVWADDGAGKPGVEIVPPFDITPETTLINTQAFTIVDLRHIENLLVGNNFWVGYSSEYGTVYGLQEAADETGETGYNRSYDGTWNGDNSWTWTPTPYAGTNYAIRAVIEFPIMGIEDINFPTTTSLFQNYPNPFNPNTTIDFSIPKNNSQIKLVVYNVSGQIVNTLVDEVVNAGMHSTTFDASTLNSGVYYYSLEVNGSKEATKKMVLIK